MMPDSNIPNQGAPEALPKGKLLIAILLGLLTFVVTPITSTIIAIPFFFLGKLSESSPTAILMNIFGLRELGGYFIAYFLLFGFLVLLGDFTTAVISWFVTRSNKLATITFLSALSFQIVIAAIVVPMAMKESGDTMEAGITSAMSYQHSAKIGNAGFTLHEPYSDVEIGNRHPEYGPLYKKLHIVVPVSVSMAGVYQAHVEYSYSKAGERGRGLMKDVTETFGVGEHTMEVEFIDDGSYGFWSPASVGGTAVIQLTYLVSEQELIDKYNADPSVDKKIPEKILKDKEKLLKGRGLDTSDDQIKPTISQYVERKEVHF